MGMKIGNPKDKNVGSNTSANVPICMEILDTRIISTKVLLSDPKEGSNQIATK